MNTAHAGDTQWASSIWIKINQPLTYETLKDLFDQASEKKSHEFLRIVQAFKTKFNIRTAEDWTQAIKTCPVTQGSLGETPREAFTQIFSFEQGETKEAALAKALRSYPQNVYNLSGTRVRPGYLQIDVTPRQAPAICLTAPLTHLQAQLTLGHEMIHAVGWGPLPSAEEFLTQFKSYKDLLKHYLEEPGGEYEAFFAEYKMVRDLSFTWDEMVGLKVIALDFYHANNFDKPEQSVESILEFRSIQETYDRFASTIYQEYLEQQTFDYLDWLEKFAQAALNFEQYGEAQRLQNFIVQINGEAIVTRAQQSRPKGFTPRKAKRFGPFPKGRALR